MSSRLSILSVAELNFVRQKLMNSRRQQLEQLPLDITLHEFVLSVSTQDELTAWNQDGSLVTWKADSGFSVKFPEGFFADVQRISNCFKAVRQCYFENFLSSEDRQLLSQAGGASIVWPEPMPGKSVVFSEPRTISFSDSDSVNDSNSDSGNGFDNDSASGSFQAEDVQAEEVTDIPSESDSMAALSEEPPAEHHFEDEDDDEDLLSKMEDLGSRKIVDHDGLDADEFSNLDTDEESSESDSHSPSDRMPEENQDDAMNALLSESEPLDEVEILKMEMLATGMDEGKANKLLAAVRSGKATVGAVRQTLKKLAGS
jgi:hypothetical protein